ncbi:transketolase family protein [Bacillus carboniphilus]|uniref:1-deoxy-D-xylulose-5-phosphate synthase n=1 Tax=Bacillus carboniphilus TaxID=86663 RepID=A0ABP3FIB1_9BACI
MKVTTKSMRNAFGAKLAEMAKTNPKVVALDGDLGNSTRLSMVEEQNPSSFLQMGIAEQNMVGVAAGLATTGIIPWVCSFAAFLTRRAYDQIVVSVDQPSLNVKLVGAYSGLLTSNTGKSHHSFEDIALMQTLPNMVVIAPGDAEETVQAMEAVNEHKGPTYLRLSRDETLEILPGSDHPFTIGQGRILHEGEKIAVLSTGSMSPRVYKAVKELATEDVQLTHAHFPTIKPLDHNLLKKLAESHSHLVTVEEHFISSGFGSAVSQYTSSHHPILVTRIGIEDEYSQCGKDQELLDFHGLSSEKLKQTFYNFYNQGCSQHD